MAKRTMFSDQITRSDSFLSMPPSTRELYFQMLSDADNDGFLDNVRTLTRMIGASVDDYNLLVLKKFIIEFDSGVIVIKHWRIHNLMRMDRYKPTVYQKEKALLDLKENKAYVLKEINIDLFTNEIAQNDDGFQNGNQWVPQVKESKVKISKVKKKEIYKEKRDDANDASPTNSTKKTYGEFKNVLLTDDELSKLSSKIKNYLSYIEKLSSYKESTGKKYKSDYATLLNWTRKDGENQSEKIDGERINYVPRSQR